MNTAYVDGEYRALEEARVPVLDRGFLFADAVYEVIPVYGGAPFRLSQHLDRLSHSLRALGIPDPHDKARWQALLEDLVERNGGGDLALYLQVTRGVQGRRDHVPPDAPEPCVVAFCQSLPEVSRGTHERGVKVVTRPDFRWRDCHIKTTALVPNLLARHQASEADAAETLLIRDGELMEASASNVFVVREGILTTPPKSRHILPGITRDLVLELAGANAVPYSERTIAEETLSEAEEIWLTSSTREITPVTRLDGRPVGSGEPGPVWRRLDELLQAYKETPPRTVKI